MAVNRTTWTPPTPPQRGDAQNIAGALGGSRLWQQPQQAADKARLDRFVAPGPPLAIELGFDHGITLLDHARCFEDWRWLGAEIRRRRVDTVAAKAAELGLNNCLPLRVDARVLVATLLPPARVRRVDILFPTPALKGPHLLLTPVFVDNLRRVLAPGGCVHLRTDVPALYELARQLLAEWTDTAPPPTTDAWSRRERICRRDGLPIWQLTVRPDRTGSSKSTMQP